MDPHRAGHEASYYPGETNVRLADVVIINKVDTAPAEAVAKVRETVKALNPKARIVEAACPVKAADPGILKGRRVLAIDDGPTRYPHVKRALPALGYGDKQVKDLEATIARAAEGGVEAVAIGTPIDLARLISIPIPSTRVSYTIALKNYTLDQLLAPLLTGAAKGR